MDKKIFPEERLELIYKKILEKKKVLVNELADEFGMSRSTVRMDLAELESRRLIKRTHGGAILLNDLNAEDGKEMVRNILDINLRIEKNQAEKYAIGKLTASLINNGDTIMIDGGSTTQCVAKNLGDKSGLTIITNSFYMLNDLISIKDSAVYLAGGIVYKENCVLIGDLTNDFVSRFMPHKLILGIDGISLQQGLTVANSMVPAVASIKKKMIESCSQLIIVADHTKIGRVCVMPVAPLKRVDYIITDDGVSPEVIESIRAAGINVMVAPVIE